jgi:hypothetical protein
MQIIPLQATPNQTFNVGLSPNQQCRINVYQKQPGLFFDLYLSDVAIITGVLCFNLNLLVRNAYLGFIGDFAFVDNQGTNDPDYTGLGSRYQLVYLAPGDIAGQATPTSTPAVPGSGSTPATGNAGGFATVTASLNANATTTVVTAKTCTLASVIIPSPLTPDAANDMATMSFVAGTGQFTITHANNARTDRTFTFVILG